MAEAVLEPYAQSNRRYFGQDPFVYPVVALNSAHGFPQPLPREGWLSNQCRHLDQSKSDLPAYRPEVGAGRWKLSSKG